MWLAELGEERAAADRHAACFLGLARSAHAGWTGHHQILWYHRIAETHADLCAALEHLLVHDGAAAQEMAGRIGFFWCCCGHLPETRKYAQRALDAGPSEGPHRTRLLWVLGVCALLQGDYPAARRLGDECSGAAAHDGTHESLTYAAAYLRGLTDLLTGHPETSLREVERVLRYHRGHHPRRLGVPAALPPDHGLRTDRPRPARRGRRGGHSPEVGLQSTGRCSGPCRTPTTNWR